MAYSLYRLTREEGRWRFVLQGQAFLFDRRVPYPFAQCTNPISKGLCKSGCEGTTRRV